MFKKIFLVLVLALGLNAESLFVGVNAGVPITTPKYSGGISSYKDMFPKTGTGYNLGVNVGYIDDLGPNDGFRVYVDYSYSQSSGKRSSTGTNVKASIASQMVALNLDYYYDFTELLGAYLGIGAGYVLYKPKYTIEYAGGVQTMTLGNKQKGGFALPLNVGFLLHIDDDHEFSLGAKIPLIDYKYNITNPAMSGSVKLRNYIVSIGYHYVF